MKPLQLGNFEERYLATNLFVHGELLELVCAENRWSPWIRSVTRCCLLAREEELCQDRVRNISVIPEKNSSSMTSHKISDKHGRSFQIHIKLLSQPSEKPALCLCRKKNAKHGGNTKIVFFRPDRRVGWLRLGLRDFGEIGDLLFGKESDRSKEIAARFAFQLLLHVEFFLEEAGRFLLWFVRRIDDLDRRIQNTSDLRFKLLVRFLENLRFGSADKNR